MATGGVASCAPMFSFIGKFRFGRCGMQTAIFLVMATCCQAADMSAATGRQGLFELVRALGDGSKFDRHTIEHLTGSPLSPVPGNNPLFDYYEGRQVRLKDVAIERLSYHEPSADGSATVGPSLIITLAGACIRTHDVLARFKDVQVVPPIPGTPVSVGGGGSPSSNLHEVPDERLRENVFVKRGRWGEMFFKFSESECLDSVIISDKFRHRTASSEGR